MLAITLVPSWERGSRVWGEDKPAAVDRRPDAKAKLAELLGVDAKTIEEPSEIDGRWRYKRSEQDGKTLAQGALLSHHVIHQGVFSGLIDSPFVVRPDKEPKEIDELAFGDRVPGGAAIRPGIYRLEGDTLSICWGNAAKRPDSFETAGHADRTLEVYERDQEESDPDAKKLQGDWEIVDTKNPPRKGTPLRGAIITFNSILYQNKISSGIVQKKGKDKPVFIGGLEVRLDSAQNPAAIQATASFPSGPPTSGGLPGRRVQIGLRGVYRLDGDNLEIALGTDQDPPRDTKVRTSDQYWLLQLQRVKEP